MSTAYAFNVGDTVVHTPSGKRRKIIRITPPGTAGTSFSDGPTYHAVTVDRYGDAIPGGHVVSIWVRSVSAPTSDYSRVPA